MGTGKEIMESLEAGIPLVLVRVTGHSGSVPRTAGARMLVRPDGSISGTVGGGRCEAEAIAAAGELHAQSAESMDPEALPGALLKFSLRGVTDMDMICGGTLTLLLELLPSAPELRALFTAAQEAENSGQPLFFLSRFKPSSRNALAETREQAANPAETLFDGQGTGSFSSVSVQHFLLTEDGRIFPPGTRLPQAVPARAAIPPGDEPLHWVHEDWEYVLEYAPRPSRLFLFGGGHVSGALAHLALDLGFHVTVLDDRPEFVHAGRFPGTAALVLPSLSERDAAAALAGENLNARDGIVIMTRGHAHDRDVLAAALETKAGYIGMIGSMSKRAAIYASLEKKGVARRRFQRVNSPIGLDIGAETPAEIAVSIAAQLIHWRSGNRKS